MPDVAVANSCSDNVTVLLNQLGGCNGNGIPDECDVDCGAPGGPCDLPGCGQSEDCNDNGVPDECDIAVCGDGCMTGTEECDGGIGNADDCCSDFCEFEPNTHLCRPADDVCDMAEFCDGASPECPQDEPEPSTTECRSVQVGDVCDAPEFCDGQSNACPQDEVMNAGVECRTAPEICDVPEQCDGVSKTCPPDDVAAEGVECRASTSEDGCDPAEVCDGQNKLCPDDITTTVCRHDDHCCPLGCIGPDPGNNDPGNDNDCPQPTPTVSAWGLMVLALLMMVTGKVYFGRRPAPVAA